MDRRNFIGSLGAGLLALLGLAGCGRKIIQNSGEIAGNASETPGSQTTVQEQPATNTVNSGNPPVNASGTPSATSGSATPGSPTTSPEPIQPPAPANSILIAYFSHTGNTRKIANQIHARVGSDIFEIKTVTPYPDDFNACLEQAKRERISNYRPQLQNMVANMASYEVVFLGFPYWIGYMPMALYTFLENHDLAKKTVIPFCTYNQSGMGGIVDHIRKLCRRSTVLDGIAIQRSTVDTAQNEVAAWLRGMGYIK